MAVVALSLMLVMAVILIIRRPSPSATKQESDKTSARTNHPATQTTASIVAPSATNQIVRSNSTAIIPETAIHRWLAADGRDTNVIRQWAHNDLEYERLVAENDRIKRRQLVYRKDTTAAVMQRSRLSGESVKQLTLPGLDGRELQVEIERTDLEPSQQSGTFTGRLTNRPNSLVTVSFKFGREAFTILSPEDGTFLQGHPREPGEIIITSFDPDGYQPVPGGEPIRTTQK